MTPSAPTIKDQKRLDADDIVRKQSRRTGERVWKETTVTGRLITGERERERGIVQIGD